MCSSLRSQFKLIDVHGEVGWSGDIGRDLEVCSSLREQSKCLRTAAVLSGAETSSTRFEEFSVSTADTNDVGELKLSFEVFGNKTQRTFDYVFQKMVEAAQPIPGFRRVKGGEVFLWPIN
ncbi:trigger factor-like protein [Trifolium pratense]|uniref:Trigger factor-like protein n=1 Tax=Trifolium pratense TaxID=57577 RepID=A0A2K3L8B9_TRIPR|nr:trigger factor-like protein [Trifolium pratense]